MRIRDYVNFPVGILVGIAVLMFSAIIGVPAYYEHKAQVEAKSYDGQTLTVVEARWYMFQGNIECDLDDGRKVTFPCHTPFAESITLAMCKGGRSVLPVTITVHYTEERQISESYKKAGLLAHEWQPGTWLEVEPESAWETWVRTRR